MVFTCIRPEADDEMKIRQNIRHFATKKALTMPVIGDIATEKMVDLHVRIFSERADPDRRGEREDHMAAFFECTFDTYLAALDAGFPEAEAREITHVQANFDFYNHGWTEMMEIPVDEIEAHYERYEEFFERHGIDIAEPLGEFRTIDIPDAPATLDKLDDPDHPHAEGGFADDVYVEDDSGEVGVGGADEPEDVDVSAAPGMQDVDRTDERTA
ncbi:DUF6149 family protein [Haloferax volcanii]|uniref:Uncharacterized protein n=3 Tax=Haloferax volcanii TaxID=2246 RepID=L9V729_HALVD|nr:DUF6149 family protein [Haloferax volcanii]ELY32786.1 hypothetical protein C498_07000 [Haloferax volcanii DS2]MBS8120066.1 hypothetical protein [Haloferax volcanii]MBS8125104.1 hypothetical protein [Haloferax volcanii]MBS8128973.1 hypothetical protein [Haloferax volcanii]MBS8132837.1 hypothetical protein [Haloferax volcanii]